ncbi:leucine-rich repeat domain-containing protein [Xanthocytophaga agilis]|uniref:Leucine-rich repeat domain-containing protein n=1 Tax=Xanthocytophaga agilis TaxID=3048010 RepID=A0AAE3RDY7_9BACT|nr:leucine-rich repeat domain-containing protein [Xanthocytophaga agilis]MDJ1506048.1 leucine-rich repeat domain-containing protein [Xanthocytophaga agilis]
METTRLNFKEHKLIEFPVEIRNAKNLTNLNLEDNSISIIPEWLAELQSLKVIYLSNNRIQNIDVLTQIPSLEVLHLINNQIRHLPDTIGRLQNLKRLYLTGNQLTSLPIAIGELRQLKHLLLGHNQLKSLPAWIAMLSRLEVLNLFDNQLKSLPTRLGQLEQLTYLQLSCNQLTYLPSGIKGLKKLTHLDFFSHYFEQLPEELMYLDALQHLNIGDNRLKRIEYIPSSVKGLSIYANPLEYIDDQVLISLKQVFANSYFAYLYIDTQQQANLKIKPEDYERAPHFQHVKVVDLQGQKMNLKRIRPDSYL